MSDSSMDDRTLGGATSSEASDAYDAAVVDEATTARIVTDLLPASLTAVEGAAILRRLATVTTILRGWIWETDAEHRFTFMSDSVKKFSGHPPEWHYGKTRQDLGNLSPNNSEHQKYIRQLQMHEMFGPVDFVRYQDGHQFWIRTIGLPQFDGRGKFTGYCGVAFDVSAEVEAKQGNRRAEPRRRLARSATILEHGTPSPVPCVVLDISQSGARLDVHSSAAVPMTFKLVIDLEGTERLCQMVWRKENSMGVRFID